MAAPDMSNLDLSPEETKRMATLMKDPKFMEMFVDYAQEISDPKNREEMDHALKEAEKRGEKVPGFPEDKELLVPYASFCIKTKDEKSGAKVFINICHSDKIKEAIGKDREDKSGTEWDIPYSLGPPAKEKDKGGAECDVHDFVINTETQKTALQQFHFKKFIIETAIDAIEKQRHVKLSRDFILPRLKYKGPTAEPRMLTISKFPSQDPPKNTTKGPVGRNMQSAPNSPASGSKSNTPRATSASSNQSGKGHNDVEPKSKNEEVTSEYIGTSKSSRKASEAENNSLPEPRKTSATSTTMPDWTPAKEEEPKYKLVYRNHFDMAQFWEDKANLKVGNDEVKEIVLHVHLPGVVDLSDIKLDVGQTEVAVIVPSKFNLKVHLTYQIDADRGQAKFDRDKLMYQLEVTLPVVKYIPRVEHDKKSLMM